MFGKTIDYYILRFFTHSRNKASEAELDEIAKKASYSLQDAHDYIEKIKIYFQGDLLVNPNLSYLDVGCGMGRLSIGLSLAGARDVTGIDIVQRHIEEANNIAKNLPKKSRPNFIFSDIHDWDANRKFDVVIVLGAMEHIHHPESFLKMLAELVKPNGKLFVSFEPFQGPIGDHMSSFFWFSIPWKGLLFSEKAIMKLRKENYRPTDPAEQYKDIVGGLNLMWYEEYIRYVNDAGLKFVKHIYNPQLQNIPKYFFLYQISRLLTRIPKIRGFFILSEYSILKR